MALIVIAALTSSTLIYKDKYDLEVAARVTDAANAKKAADDKIAEAKKNSDEIVTTLHADLDAANATSSIYRDMIANAKPVDEKACPPSDAQRDASRSLRANANALPAGPPPARPRTPPRLQ